MAISEHGAKVAAGKLGITVHAYRLHEAAREYWCPLCRQWLPEQRFNRQRTGARRLTSRCRDCNSEYGDKYRHGVIVRRNGGAVDVR